VSNVNVRSTLRGGGDRRNVCNTNVPVVLNGALCESIVHYAILGGAHGEQNMYELYMTHVRIIESHLRVIQQNVRIIRNMCDIRRSAKGGGVKSLRP
jgi:hypothetical protein